jgi:hypothetical protein
MDHEAAFARAFITSEKRARFLQYLGDPRRRPEMLERLSRHLPCLPECATEVPSEQDFPSALEKLLRARGAGPTCHVMAQGLKADRRELPLREALNQVCLHAPGGILSCVPGRLAYYRPHSPAPGMLLEGVNP